MRLYIEMTSKKKKAKVRSRTVTVPIKVDKIQILGTSFPLSAPFIRNQKAKFARFSLFKTIVT